MAENLYARLSSIVKPSTVTEIASMLGTSEQAVARALALSTAAAFAGLARKADDSETLRQVIDLASKTRSDAVVSAVSAGQLTDSSPLLSEGRRFLAMVFGSGQNTVLNAISRESGLKPAAAAALLPLGAQSLLNFFGMRLRDEGMTPGTLASFLRREAPEIRRAIPMALDEATAPVTHRLIETNPVVAQAVVRSHRSIVPWLLASAAALLCAFWLSSRPDRLNIPTPGAPASPIAVGTSGYIPPAPDREFSRRPDRTFTPETTIAPGKTASFDLDRVLFNTGSATLRPRSAYQLGKAAAFLKANPNASVTINGYTDNVGAPAKNLMLSQQRAANVMKALERRGVSANHLEAIGHGEEHPVADNSTEAGRAMNRRISMEVSRK